MPDRENTISEEQVRNWLLGNPEAMSRIMKNSKAATSSQDDIASPEMQRTLFDIAKMLNSSLDLTAVIKKLLHVTLSVVRAEKCSLFLLDKENNQLYDIAFDIG
jgi:hypothetical protein